MSRNGNPLDEGHQIRNPRFSHGGVEFDVPPVAHGGLSERSPNQPPAKPDRGSGGGGDNGGGPQARQIIDLDDSRMKPLPNTWGVARGKGGVV